MKTVKLRKIVFLPREYDNKGEKECVDVISIIKVVLRLHVSIRNSKLSITSFGNIFSYSPLSTLLPVLPWLQLTWNELKLVLKDVKKEREAEEIGFPFLNHSCVESMLAKRIEWENVEDFWILYVHCFLRIQNEIQSTFGHQMFAWLTILRSKGLRTNRSMIHLKVISIVTAACLSTVYDTRAIYDTD